jgi:hypothetical protein
MRFQHNPFTDKLDISGMGPNATTSEFLTGNDGIPVPSDASYNIFVFGENASGINTTGNAGTSTLTIHGLASSTTQIGTTRYATNVEAAAQTLGTVALTPANITSFFSSNALPASQGGTGLASPAAHQLMVSNGALPFSLLGVASNGQIPIGSIGSDPVLATLTPGTGITITNGPGSITIDAMGSVAITFTEDSGSATPALNNLNILGTPSQGISTSGSGSTVTLTVADATTTTKGVASFDSTNFSVTGGAVTSDAISVTSGNNITTDASWNLGGSVSIAVSGTTNHALQLGNASGSLTSLGVATNGQIPIGSTGADPVLATITGTSGITVTNGAGSITISASGSGLAWVDVTGVSQSIAVNTGYLSNNAGTVAFSLPASANLGDVFRIVGVQGAWTLSQAANQRILFGSISTTLGIAGSLASTNAGDCVELVATNTSASTAWRVISSIGNITVT